MGVINETEKIPRIPIGPWTEDKRHKIVATAGALEAARQAGEDQALFVPLLARHFQGDWGEVCDEDVQTNNKAARKDYQVLSVYTLETGAKLWVITDPGHRHTDRKVTTILLPEEY